MSKSEIEKKLDIDKKFFAELLGWKLEGYVGSDGEVYLNEHGGWVSINFFNPESEEYYWKIITVIRDKRLKGKVFEVLNNMEWEEHWIPSNLGFFDTGLLLNTHRKEVLNAIKEVMK